MTAARRQYKFAPGDWVAVRGLHGWVLAGKVVDADSESCTAEHRGVQTRYVPEEDPIARVRWIGRGRWTL